MKKKPTNANESQANAKLSVSHIKVTEMIDITRKVAKTIKDNPSYANQPELQGAVTSWLALADALENEEHTIHTKHASIFALTASRGTALGVWKRATKKVVANVSETSAGSAEAITQWGFEVATRATSTPTSDAPLGLKMRITKDLALTLEWKGVRGQRGYLLQIGDGTPAGWGSTIHLSEPKYIPQGLQPGQHVTARVAVQRTNGVSAWSDALAFIAR